MPKQPKEPTDPVRKTIALSADVVKRAEDRYKPEFGELNWSAYVNALIERDVRKAREVSS